jgi:Protein kinase domain/WD domain, G-beta repeat
VLLAADGPRVIDFGITRALDATALTQTGMLVGTPGFMSPEQAEGTPAGPPSDVFSLGSVLAFAVTGAGPFGEGTPASLIYRIVHAQPALDTVPGPLRDLIAGCLAKAPADRPTLAHLMDTISARSAPPTVPFTVSFWPPDLAAHIASYQQQLTTAPAWPQHGALSTMTAQRPAGPAPPASPDPPATHSPRRRRGRRAALAAGIGALAVTAVTAGLILIRPAPGHNPGAGAASSSPAVTGNAPRVQRSVTDPNTWPQVETLACSPNGRTLVTGDERGIAYLWDTATGHRIATLNDHHTLHVFSAVFSPDGQTVATGGFYGHVNLWDAATGKLIGTLTYPTDVWALAFSPDGKMLAITGNDANVNAAGTEYDRTDVWDVATRQRITTFFDPGATGISAVAFSPDGTTLVTGDDNGRVFLRDVATWRRIATFIDPHRKWVQSVAFSPDGRTLAIGDVNGDTYLWNLAARHRIAVLADPVTAHGAAVGSVAFSPDGRTLATGDWNGHAYLWSTATWQLSRTLAVRGLHAVRAVAFCSSASTLATGDGNGDADLWHLPG